MQTNNNNKVLVILFAIFLAMMMAFALAWTDVRGRELYETGIPFVVNQRAGKGTKKVKKNRQAPTPAPTMAITPMPTATPASISCHLEFRPFEDPYYWEGWIVCP